MPDNRAVDGSLIFDTKINKDSFEKDIAYIEKKVEEKDLEIKVDTAVDKAELEKDIKEIERTAEKKDIEVAVDTAVDDKGLKNDIAKLDDTAEKALNQLGAPIKNGELTFDTRVDSEGFAKAGEVMKGVLGANLLEKGLEKIVEFGKKGIDLASDLEEVQNVVDVTFGDGADKIEAFAQSASSSFGLTELQAKQFSGTIGAMVKSMGLTDKAALEMSTALVGLTGDMASFYNLDHQTAFDKIRSGIAGETEPLKALGINMSVANLEAYALSKGIKTAYDKMSEAEKVQLRYGYIMQQTTDAQGDFVRTQDSYANQVRVLQNNLDTLAANVGSLLIPALTSAVGWVNNLFAGPGTENKTQSAIDDAISSLGTLDTDLQDIKNNYAKEAITIQLNYEEAGELLETLESLKAAADKGFGDRTLKLGMTGDDVTALQNQLISLGYAIDIANEVGKFGTSTEAALKQYQTDMGLVADGIAGAKTYAALAADDTEKMQKVTAELVALYPELEKYVGKDGILHAEGEQVDALIEKYRNLQLEKLMASRVEQIGGEYADAAIDMELLKQKAEDASKELEELNKQQNAMQNAAAGIEGLYTNLAPGANIDTAAAVNAIKTYMSTFGGLSDEIYQAFEQSGDVTLDDIFKDGVLMTPEEIAQSEASTEALKQLALAIRFAGTNEQNTLADDIAAAQAALESAQAAVSEYAPVVEQAMKDYESAKKALENFGKEAPKEGTETGKTVVQSAADEMENQKPAIETATDTLIDAAQEKARKRPVIIPVRFRTFGGPGGADTIAHDGSHATGLDRVPYNNYLANLHVGEAVLTASEAQRWRSGEGGGVTPAQLTAAMEPVVDAISNIRIALDIDGRQFASNQAANVRSAQNRYNTQIAKGMGK